MMFGRRNLLQLFGLLFVVFTQECVIEMEENLAEGTTLPQNFLQCLNIDASTFQGSIQSQEQINNGAQYLSNSYLTLSRNGSIRIAKVVDRDTLCSSNQAICHMKHSVIIYNSQTDSMHNLILQIYVKDKNDNVPRFKVIHKVLQIMENTVQAQPMLLPAAYDADSLENLTYQLLPATSHFALYNSTPLVSGVEPQLLQLQALDFEKIQELRFTLLACDGANQCSTAPLSLLIKVEDQNDNAPIFLPPYVNPTLPAVPNMEHDATGFPTLRKLANGQYKYTTSVREDESGILLRIRVHDADSDANARVKFNLESATESVENDFAINPLSFHKGITEGELVIKNTLNPKSDNLPYVFNIRATDFGAPSMQTIAMVEILVIDINNHKPEITWSKPFFEQKGLQLVENKANPKIALISVIDLDLGDNGKVHCSLSTNYQSAQFHLKEISSSNYMLSNDHIYDCERFDNTTVEIDCRDSGKPLLSSSLTLSIPIVDVNEWPPVFTKKIFQGDMDEDESEYVSRYILRVQADDKDCTKQLTYAIINDDANYFRIDSNTGAIYTARNIDREQMHPSNFQRPFPDVIEFSVRVTDGQFNDKAMVRVTINDINDNVPVIQHSLPIRVKENETIGKEIGKIDAHDNDKVGHPNSQVHFSLIIDTSEVTNQDASEVPFEVTSDGRIRLRKSLDREMKAHYLLYIKAVDGSVTGVRHTSSGSVTILVEDINDNKPYFQQPPQQAMPVLLYDSAKVGSVAYTLVASDMDEVDRGRLTYQILPEITQSFEINQTTGEITVRRQLTPGEINLFIRTSDGHFLTDSSLHFNITKDARRIKGAQENQTFELNFTLVVIMVAVTSSICVTLVVIIVLLYRRQCRSCLRSRSHWQQNNVLGKERANTNMEAMYTPVDAHITDDTMGANLSTFGQVKCNDSQLVVDSTSNFVRRTESPLQKAVHQQGTRRNPYDLEVASADSGHEASEEDTLSELKSNAGTVYYRYHTLPHRTFGESSHGQTSDRVQPPSYTTLNRVPMQSACSCSNTAFTNDSVQASAAHGCRGFNRTNPQSPLALSDTAAAYCRSSPASLSRPQFTTTRINITPNVISSTRANSNNGCVTPLHWT